MLRFRPFILSAMAASAILTFAQKPGEGKKEAAETLANDTTFTTLDEIVIQADKPVIQSDGAKLTYNAEEDPTTKSGTVIDLLRKVPGITVDGNDNIQVNGKSGFKIFVNGREDPMLSQNASTILKNMPSSYIKKVEVITEPGAKYDAEGTGGIINLVTETKQSNEGYSGNISLGLSRQGGLTPSLYGIAKYGKVTVSANATYMNGHIFPQGHENSQEIIYHSATETGRLLNSGYQKIGFNYYGGGINLSWEPDDKNLFTLASNVYDVDAKIKDILMHEQRYDAADALLWQTRSRYSGKMINLGVTANASYQHNFAPQNNNLILSYQFNFGKSNLDLNRRYDLIENTTVALPFQDNLNNNLTREHTLQLDYVNGFGGDKHLLETGAKSIFRHNGTFSYVDAGTTADNIVNLPGAESVMTQIQNVYAVYGSYTGRFGNLSTKAGVRYENTHMGIDYAAGLGQNFRTNLNDVVPNAALSWNFDYATSLRAAYQMRISRPTLEQVNPYRQDILGYMVQTGNPDLKSERSNNVTLTFSKFGRTLGGNIGVGYTDIDNMIASYTYLDGKTLVTTYGNLGSHRTFNINGFINWSIINGMSANIAANVDYNYFHAPTMELKNHGWSWGCNASWNYRPREDWNFSAFGGYSSSHPEIDSKSGGWHYYGLSVGKDLLKDKSLNITVNAMNMFEDRQAWTSRTWNKDADSFRSFNNKCWNVGLNITWKFGNLQTQVKKTQSQIVNDDASKASSGSAIGGGSNGGGR